MEKYKTVGEYIAYGAITIIAFFKIFQTGYKYIKDFFTTKKEDTAKITVNVGSSPLPYNKNIMGDDSKIFLYFLLEQGKIITAMTNLRSGILKEQMDYFTKNMQNIRVIMTGSMIRVLTNFLNQNTITEQKYEMYLANFENFLEVSEYKLHDMFRSMCKANHFSEYTNTEYRELVTKNISIIEGKILDLIRKKYPQREFIKDFPELNENKIMIRNGLRDCFEFARETALEKENKVNCAKVRFEEQVSEIIGMKYSLEI